MLLLISPDEDTYAYYQIVSGPVPGEGYRVESQTLKLVDKKSISGSGYVGEIEEKDKDELLGAIVSVRPRFSQSWVIGVIHELQRRQLLPAGTWELWLEKMEKDPYSERPKDEIEDTGEMFDWSYSPLDIEHFSPQEPRDMI
jgi:hypothetical protein